MNNYHRILAIILSMAVLLLAAGYMVAQEKAPDVVTLKGAPMGGVQFNHKVHAAGYKCDVCHHASKPEKPATAQNQKCTDCHTRVATAPMKTKLQGAFHNPTATAGVCIDCHKTDAAAKGKNAPVKCADCHKKENA